VLAVKKLTFENARATAYSFYFGFMVIGAILGGPIVDLIRHDYKTTTWHYTHHNPETDRDEDRVQEFSAWRTIAFVGFSLNLCMIILLCFYRTAKEEPFKERDVDWDEIGKLTFCQIFRDLFQDRRFWRFMLFSLVIVGPKLVFALLFFMLPRIIMQDYGEDAPFGIYVAVAPVLILLFLWLL
jgi:MFS family permease